MKKGIDIVHGKLFPTMIAFAIPLVLSSVLQTLYNAADSLIVGRYESANALGAVGSAGPIVNILLNLFMGLTVGTNILVARYRGGGREDMVKKASDTSIIIGLFSGILVGLIGFFLAAPIARLVKIDSEIIDMTILYMQVFFLGIPFTALYNFIAATMRGIGNTKGPMITLIISGLVNVVFNIIFVKYMGLGVLGVAVATVISQFLALVMIFVMLKKGEVGFSLKTIAFDKHIMTNTFKIGLPAGIQGMTFSVSNTIITSAVNSFGAAAASGRAIVSQVEGICYVAANSVGQAATTFSSQYIGAGKVKKLNSILWTAMGIAMTAVVIMSLGFYAAQDFIIEMFAPGDVQTAKFAKIAFDYILLPYLLEVIMEIPAGTLRGMGATLVSMLGTVLGVCGIRWIWTLLLLPLYRDCGFLYLCYPVSWIFVGVLLIIIHLGYQKKLERLIHS